MQFQLDQCSPLNCLKTFAEKSGCQHFSHHVHTSDSLTSFVLSETLNCFFICSILMYTLIQLKILFRIKELTQGSTKRFCCQNIAWFVECLTMQSSTSVCAMPLPYASLMRCVACRFQCMSYLHLPDCHAIENALWNILSFIKTKDIVFTRIGATITDLGTCAFCISLTIAARSSLDLQVCHAVENALCNIRSLYENYRNCISKNNCNNKRFAHPVHVVLP